LNTAFDAFRLPENRLMNRRVWVCIGLILWSELLAGRAYAQSAASPSSPIVGVGFAAKGALDASSYRSQILQFVQTQEEALTGQDPIAQKAAREKLISECTPGSSASYLDNYAQVIDTVATQILSRKPPLRVRLNVAVIVQEVGRISRSKALEGSVLILINDPSEPVGLRGMQAVKPVVFAVVSDPATAAADKLMNAILPAVKAHEKSGYIAAEAYHALIPENTLPPTELSEIDPLVLGPILDILNYRISLYTTGIPDNPSAETDVPTFLYRSYKNAPLELQHRIVQTLVDLIVVAGQQSPATPKEELDEIIQTLRYAAGALTANNANLGGTLDSITNLNKSTPGSIISQKVSTVFGLLQPQFPFLHAPPTVTPAPAPATKPAP
jgi:hypothetical protein